ncbi:MAG TPA: urease accessory UreF family protein [Verrucomicrobiae bacterium]
MSEQIHPAFDAANESIDARPLTEQLGSADELTTLSPIACSTQLTKVHSIGSLREFVIHYREEALAPLELRQIYAAYNFATKNYIRELLALDEQLAKNATLEQFEIASRHVGRRQLNRLRAMKDLKLVQRYREAVNEGKAYGWHTLVYGIVLSTYSLPLRQGLLHYGRQTLGGFIHSAQRTLDLPEEAVFQLQYEVNSSLPKLIDQTIQLNGSAFKLLS